MKFKLFAWFWLLFLCFGLHAQTDSLLYSLNNWRSKKILASDEWQSLDSLTIFGHTFECVDPKTGELLPASFYELHGNKIRFPEIALSDSVFVRYRVLPYNLEERKLHLDTAWIRIDPRGYSGFDYNPYESPQNPQESLLGNNSGIDYQGSFERGISFGNNQNLVLNSSFNLQLAGSVGDDIEILAAISDQNIPLQPEGNTQQIQDFDRIFIQLKKDKNKLIAGDYELLRPKSYFVNYFKKLQGATFSNEVNLWNKGQLRNQASVAISKGKFARNELQVQEGNQGPYLLRGAENERFVIVLSGTEKVYFDGLLLTRGMENDYVIDYNRGEISFTAKRLITKDVRIIIEFEYSDQNYLRSLYALSSEYEAKRWTMRFNLFSEQDSKTSSIQQDLTPEQQQRLSEVGDDVQNAFASGIDTLDAYQNDRILYELRDTFYYFNANVIRDTVLVYSTNPDKAHYSVRFSDLGANKGNYQQTSSSANGRVYKWVAPDPITGLPQGNFAPLIQLVAPKQQQLFSLSTEYKLKRSGSIYVEGSFSQNDLNRFSNLNSEDDAGQALYANYSQQFSLGKKQLKQVENRDSIQKKKSPFLLDVKTSYEYKGNNFQALNPYRNAEFSRDWNIAQSTGNKLPKEHLLATGFQLSKANFLHLDYGINTYLQDTLYRGIKHSFGLDVQQKGFQLKINGNYLDAQSQVENSRFFRPKAELSKTFWKNARIGLYGEREQNKRVAVASDSLSKNSFYYDLLKIYVNSPEWEKVRFNISYHKRWDYAAVAKNFKNNTLAEELALNGYWNEGQISQLNWNFSYRNLQIIAPTLTNQKQQSTYLGRLDHNFVVANGVLRSNINYEIGAGQEPKREFTYRAVNAGEGQYQWIDYNDDGNQQINEFELAAFQDSAIYVRIPLFNNEFIRVNTVQYSHSLRFVPKLLWERKQLADQKKTPSFWQKSLSKFSSESSLRITRKTQEANEVLPFNPFQMNVSDTALVSLIANIRNVLFFNRNDAVYDIQLGASDIRNRNILTTGYEGRRQREQFLRGRWNISKSVAANLSLSQGRRESDSEAFANRDYEINYYQIEPKLTYYISKNLRVIGTYAFGNASNQLGNKERSTSHDANVELTYNRSADSSLRCKFSLVGVDYTGAANTPIEYALLQGLRNGDNYLWSLSLDRRVAKNILLGIGYDGRKTGGTPIVHTGRATVRAIF